MQFNRTHNIEDLNSGMVGQKVIFGGWIEDLRKLGKMTFLTVRDVTGLTQVIVKDDNVIKEVEGITRQSVFRVEGNVQETKARDFECEVKAEKIDVLAKAVYPLPISFGVLISINFFPDKVFRSEAKT